MSPKRSRARAALLLVLFMLPTAVFFRAQLMTPIDVENHALKA
jgi:hypothetical protein